MPAIDPSLAAAGTAGDAIEREFAVLAANARQLRAQLQDGAVVAARILRSNGLTDVVEILGRRVAAALPPDLHPGDLISVTLKGFDGARLVLQRVPAETMQTEPENAPPERKTLPPPPLRDVPQRAATPPRPAAAGGGTRLDATEARLAAARATTGTSASAPNVRAARTTDAPSSPREASTSAPAPSTVRPSATPPTRAAVASDVRGQPSANAAPVLRPATFVARPIVTTAQPVTGTPATAQRFLDAPALLAALRIELPPERLATVRAALRRPERLPEMVRALDAMLAPVDDERAAALRANLAFIERLDPHSPALSEQIAAYVSHVIDGREPKLASLAHALVHGEDHQAAAAALRVHADLGSRMLDLLADPSIGATPEIRTGAAAMLAAAGATQFQSGSALTNDPSTIALTLPIATASGSQRADIRIARKSGSPRAEIDPADVHIGFVLSTEALGTVSVDLHALDRTVRVRVTADEPTAVARFSSTLSDLETRLERLRYNVAALDAGLPATTDVEEEPEPAPAFPSAERVDLQI